MDLFLQIAFALNIAILTPVCFAMFTGRGQHAVFQGTVEKSWGLELLVGSLWLSILAASLGGLFFPRFFAPVLAIQVFYKLIWLLTFVAPAAVSRAPLPAGIATCFGLIVVCWPVLIVLGYST